MSPTAAMDPAKVGDPACNRGLTSSPVARSLLIYSEWELSDDERNSSEQAVPDIQDQEHRGKANCESSTMWTRSKTKKSKEMEGRRKNL